jgi:hypothetical protein
MEREALPLGRCQRRPGNKGDFISERIHMTRPIGPGRPAKARSVPSAPLIRLADFRSTLTISLIAGVLIVAQQA